MNAFFTIILAIVLACWDELLTCRLKMSVLAISGTERIYLGGEK